MKVVPPEEEDRLRKIMKRIKFDLIRRHPFPMVPSLPPVKNVTKESVAAAREDLRQTAKKTRSRSDAIKREIREAIRKPRACEKLGLWEEFTQRYNPTDATSWLVWRDGLDCIGECQVPDDWEDREKADKMNHRVEEFESSKVIQQIMQGVHVKPVWSDRLIQKTWDDSLKETQIIPELGYRLLEGPFDITSPEEVKYAFRRFPREQKSNKVRLIDPAVGANKCSPLAKRVPIPSPHEIHVNAAVAHDPSLEGKCVVMHNRKIIKRCRKAEKRYEAQLLQYFKGERTSIDDDLLKLGAVQPVRGEAVVFNESSPHVQKKRKAEGGEKFALEMVVIDVARCYKNIFVKPTHHKYNRLVVWNPHTQKYQWFQALTAIFGSRHSVTGWTRNGKSLRSFMRKHYGVNAEDYVDDFPVFVKDGSGEIVTEALLELLDELGLPAMMEKVDFGKELEILGLMFSVVNGAPEVFLTEQKKQLIKSVCEKAREEGSIELDELDRLVGRLTFVLTAIADRALSPVMRPLRRMLSREQTCVDESVRHALRAIESIMDLNIRRRVAVEDPSAHNVLLYTDASWEKNSGWLAGVLVLDGKFFAVREKVCKHMLHKDYDTWAINYLETIAGVFAAKFFHKQLAHKRFDHAIDNTCAQSCLLSQGSSSEKRKWYLSQASTQYWAEAVKFQFKPWIVRVPSHFNIADYPTRENLMFYLNQLYPSFFTEFTEGFGLGEYFSRSLAGTLPDCVGELAQAFADAGCDSDSD